MLQVTPLKAFSDNYIWMIHAPRDPRRVVVVDPGEAGPVELALRQRGVELGAILITHHHADHVGGVERLVAGRPVPVFGPARESIPGNPKMLSQGDIVELESLGLRFEVLDIPGHTAGHIAYVGHGALFCGDTLFSAGCGRLFEGTAEQMTDSLAKLARLDPAILVYCGHEYTLSNLRFAAAVEPNNRAVAEHRSVCEERRAQDKPTVPSTIALEHSVNPFLRCTAETVKQAAEAHTGRKLDSTVEIFAAVRGWKDNFKAAS